MIKLIKSGQTAQAKAGNQAQVRATVETILADIEQRGEAALREYSQKFDQWAPATFRLTEAQIRECIASLPARTLEDIEQDDIRVRRLKAEGLAS
jgi:sulfopropanediol 3-dehydrogenase